MRFINHQLYRHPGCVAAIVVGLCATWPAVIQARPSPSVASTASVKPVITGPSACLGRWGHPRYTLDVFEAGTNRYMVILERLEVAAVPLIVGDVTWGSRRKPQDLGTLDATSFKATFAGYGPVELTCTARGPIDQFGRLLVAKPDDAEVLAGQAEDAGRRPSQHEVEDGIADAARRSLLAPYLDDPDEAAAVTYPDLPGWLFFRTAAFCYLVREKDDGRLLIGYNRAANTAHVGFTADKLAPLAAGTKLKLDIVMANMNDRTRKAQPVRYWDPLPTTVLIGRRSYEPVYNFKLDGRQALISFSRHDAVLFMKGEDALQGFSLNGSAAAIKRLETCEPR